MMSEHTATAPQTESFTPGAEPKEFTGTHEERNAKCKALALKFLDVMEHGTEKYTSVDIAMACLSVTAGAFLEHVTPLQEIVLKSPLSRSVSAEFARPILELGPVGIIGICLGMLDAFRAEAAEIDAVVCHAKSTVDKTETKAKAIDDLMQSLSRMAEGHA
jgi:hypothetical protein